MDISEDLLIRYLNDSVTQEESNVVDSWYSSSEENREKLQNLHQVVKLDKATAAYLEAEIDESYSSLINEIDAKANKKRHSIRTIYWLSAACFLFGVFITAVVGYMNIQGSSSSYTVLTDNHNKSDLILPDGSRVKLNASSKLTYDAVLFSQTRDVKLEGEAYFSVSSNKNKPFVISANGVKVKVLGTKFNVRSREEDKVVTTLLQGAVEVSMDDGNETILMKPGQTLITDINKNKFVAVNEVNAQDILLWHKDKISFDRKPLAEITKTLQALYNVEIIYHNESLKKELFTCEFSTHDDIYSIMNVFTFTDKVKYRTEDSKLIIY